MTRAAGARSRTDRWELAARVVPATLAIVAVLLGLLLAWQLRQLILMAFVALLFAAAIHDAARWLEARGLPRGLAAAIPYLAVAGAIGLLIVLVLPPLVDQATNLVADIPSIVDAALGTVVGIIDRWLGSGTGQQVVDQIRDELEGFRPDVGPLLMLPLTLLDTLLAIGTTLFLSFLLVVERDAAKGWFLRFLDADTRPVVTDIGRSVLQKLGAYVRGQIIVMTVVGVATTAGMIILGVPFALPLGLLAFLTEAIPLVGPYISAVPIVAIAFLQDTPTGILMAIWLIVVQQAEGWILTPVIQGKVLSLSPMAVLLAVFAGGTLAGILGAVIAVPIVATLDVLIRDVVWPLRHGDSIGDRGQRRRGEEEADASDREGRQGDDDDAGDGSTDADVPTSEA
jgi:predicted PurR-regulated permease PerM